MNILFVSKDLGQIDLACRLIKEGNALRVLVLDKCWKNKVKRPGLKFIDNLDEGLKWLKNSIGFIVFDYIGQGKLQDELRSKGFFVVGGSELSEKSESNRQYGQRIFSSCGLEAVPSIDFYNIDDAIDFIKNNPQKWVVKQNGDLDKGLNYVGSLASGKDAISVLENYKKTLKKDHIHFDLQERIDGVEIAAGRFFNGNDWVGPICINIEHKNLFNGELGPKTHEMGNLMWFDDNENNKLFKETLGKTKNFLQRTNFRGYFDINCIVNEKKAFPLEATARFGQPTLQLQTALFISPWSEILVALAKGEGYTPKYKKDYAIAVFLGTPPYPYDNRSKSNSPKGLEVFFTEELSQEDLDNVHLEEVSIIDNKNEKKNIVVGKSGYIAHVSGTGKTVEEAREKTYNLIKKIVVPKVFYRTDIGLKFIEENKKKLEDWGWI